MKNPDYEYVALKNGDILRIGDEFFCGTCATWLVADEDDDSVGKLLIVGWSPCRRREYYTLSENDSIAREYGDQFSEDGGKTFISTQFSNRQVKTVKLAGLECGKHLIYRRPICHISTPLNPALITQEQIDRAKKYCEELEQKYKDQSIVVTVDKVEYFAKFYNDYVEFGCAKIDNHVLRSAFEVICKQKIFGNRVVESVNIGKGVFTYAILKSIAARKGWA